jgi:hypothetical protein
MRLICIKKNINEEVPFGIGYYNLIIGKEYECSDMMSSPNWICEYYRIIINNVYYIFPCDCFITLDEYRNQKLEELGI